MQSVFQNKLGYHKFQAFLFTAVFHSYDELCCGTGRLQNNFKEAFKHTHTDSHADNIYHIYVLLCKLLFNLSFPQV